MEQKQLCCLSYLNQLKCVFIQGEGNTGRFLHLPVQPDHRHDYPSKLTELDVSRRSPQSCRVSLNWLLYAFSCGHFLHFPHFLLGLIPQPSYWDPDSVSQEGFEPHREPVEKLEYLMGVNRIKAIHIIFIGSLYLTFKNYVKQEKCLGFKFNFQMTFAGKLILLIH